MLNFKIHLFKDYLTHIKTCIIKIYVKNFAWNYLDI